MFTLSGGLICPNFVNVLQAWFRYSIWIYMGMGQRSKPHHLWRELTSNTQRFQDRVPGSSRVEQVIMSELVAKFTGKSMVKSIVKSMVSGYDFRDSTNPLKFKS